jgi:hypothetical protein
VSIAPRPLTRTPCTSRHAPNAPIPPRRWRRFFVHLHVERLLGVACIETDYRQILGRELGPKPRRQRSGLKSDTHRIGNIPANRRGDRGRFTRTSATPYPSACIIKNVTPIHRVRRTGSSLLAPSAGAVTTKVYPSRTNALPFASRLPPCFAIRVRKNAYRTVHSALVDDELGYRRSSTLREFRFLACAANPSSSSRRIASEREGLSFCCLAQLSIANLSAGGSRRASTGSCPVRGRPRFFRNTEIDFLSIICIT